jgi:hypothetical protein
LRIRDAAAPNFIEGVRSMTYTHSTAEMETTFKASKFEGREFSGIQSVRRQLVDHFLEETHNTTERPDKWFVR